MTEYTMDQLLEEDKKYRGGDSLRFLAEKIVELTNRVQELEGEPREFLKPQISKNDRLIWKKVIEIMKQEQEVNNGQ